MTCEVQEAAAMYSASVVDREMQVFFLDCQLTSLPSINWHPPVVLFRSKPQPPRSASENACTKNPELEGYRIPRENVRLRYLNMFLTVVIWGSRGFT